MPNIYTIPELESIQEHQFSRDFKKQHIDSIKEFQPHLKTGKHGRRERIGSYIEVVVFPHRFEFILYPGVSSDSIHEMVSKIYNHMQSISKEVKINLFSQGKKSKHVHLLDEKELHSPFQKLLKLFYRFVSPTIKKPKHLVLHMDNATGGSLYSTILHEPKYRSYFMQ